MVTRRDTSIEVPPWIQCAHRNCETRYWSESWAEWVAICWEKTINQFKKTVLAESGFQYCKKITFYLNWRRNSRLKKDKQIMTAKELENMVESMLNITLTPIPAYRHHFHFIDEETGLQGYRSNSDSDPRLADTKIHVLSVMARQTSRRWEKSHT